MTQFKDCISEELCFQSLYTQLCLSPWHRKSRFHKQSDLQRLCLLWTPPKTGANGAIFFFFTWQSLPSKNVISPPAGMFAFALFSSAPPLAPFLLDGILPEPTLPIAPASGFCIMSHPCPVPLPVQHSRIHGGKKPTWNSSQKTADRSDSLPQPHRSDTPTVLILLRRCRLACAREGKVKRDHRCPGLRMIIFYLMS